MQVSTLNCPNCGGIQTSHDNKCAYCGAILISGDTSPGNNSLDKADKYFLLGDFTNCVNSLLELNQIESFQKYFLLSKAVFHSDKLIFKNEIKITELNLKAAELANQNQKKELTNYFFIQIKEYNDSILNNKNSATSVVSSHLVPKIATSLFMIGNGLVKICAERQLLDLMLIIWLKNENIDKKASSIIDEAISSYLSSNIEKTALKLSWFESRRVKSNMPSAAKFLN